ncbi:hypothetical protein B0H12DRAFT_1009936, partial [Mycena haematopus]
PSPSTHLHASMSVNPLSLSMDHSPSPDPESSEPGPSRKRPRTTSTNAEDRKEARAHRNRIAAQNSRDRRKAQFSYLERRVSELEEENRQLRAGLAVPAARPDQKAEEERERAKERENEELRERIKTLEKGWDAVMKALAAQGLSTGTALPAPSPPAPEPTPAATPDPPAKQQQASPDPTFPVLDSSMTFPISPAPSHTSLDFELDTLSSSSSFMSSPVLTPKTEHDLDSTRHLARVASIGGAPPSPMALQRVVSTSVSRSPAPTTTAAPLQRKTRSTTQPWRTCSARSSPLPRASPRRVFLLMLRVAPASKLPRGCVAARPLRAASDRGRHLRAGGARGHGCGRRRRRCRELAERTGGGHAGDGPDPRVAARRVRGGVPADIRGSRLGADVG